MAVRVAAQGATAARLSGTVLAIRAADFEVDAVVRGADGRERLADERVGPAHRPAGHVGNLSQHIVPPDSLGRRMRWRSTIGGIFLSGISLSRPCSIAFGGNRNDSFDGSNVGEHPPSI